jgi:hypothetical protein
MIGLACQWNVFSEAVDWNWRALSGKARTSQSCAIMGGAASYNLRKTVKVFIRGGVIEISAV